MIFSVQSKEKANWNLISHPIASGSAFQTMHIAVTFGGSNFKDDQIHVEC